MNKLNLAQMQQVINEKDEYFIKKNDDQFIKKELDFEEYAVYPNQTKKEFIISQDFLNISQININDNELQSTNFVDQTPTSRFLSPPENKYSHMCLQNLGVVDEERNNFSFDNNSIFLGTLGLNNGSIAQNPIQTQMNNTNLSRLLNKSEIDLMKDWNESLLEKMLKIGDDKGKLYQIIERLIFEKKELMEKEVTTKSEIMIAQQESNRLIEENIRQKAM